MFLFPTPSTLATCPNGPADPNVGGYIELQDDQGGFLSTTNSSADSRFKTTDLCLTGDKAKIPQFSIPTYAEMKSIYFDQSKLTLSINPANINADTKKIKLEGAKEQRDIKSPVDLQTANTPRMYNITGSYSIYKNMDVKSTGIIFVDQDLVIGPIEDNDNKLTHVQPDAGLVFVVGGNVLIDKSVTEVDAFIITFGQFCSAAASDKTCTASDIKLTIRGSVIYLNQDPAEPKPEFVRSYGLNSEPAEEIIYDPKYLVITKDIFAKTLSVWSEIQ